MDFSVPEKTQTMLDLMNGFVEEELMPLEPQILAGGMGDDFLGGLKAAVFCSPRSVWDRMKPAKPLWPREF